MLVDAATCHCGACATRAEAPCQQDERDHCKLRAVGANSLQCFLHELRRFVIESERQGENLRANGRRKESGAETKDTRFSAQLPRWANARGGTEPLDAHHYCHSKNC